MSYKVLASFSDSQDGNHLYSVGDTFPRDGAKVSPERIAQLASVNNAHKMPFIEKVSEEKVLVAEPAKAKTEKPAKKQAKKK